MIYQVLIIDDEEIVCRGLAEFVKWKEHGFEVAGTANSVDEALLLLKTLHIDVVFMDIRMPGKSGLTLLPVLQEKYNEIAAVILSGYSDFTYAREALRYGAFDYLTKPVILSEVGALLDRLHASFDQNQELQRVHADRMEALLLSAARGYSYIEPQKLALPVLDQWFGISMMLADHDLSEQELAEKKEAMRAHLRALVPDSMQLDDDAYSMFCIVPCSSDANMSVILGLLEQLCPELEEWFCGVSLLKKDICQLHVAWREADQAMRFLLARLKGGVMPYKNIESIYAQTTPQLQAVLQETLHRLGDPVTRSTVIAYIQDFFLNGCRKEGSLTQFQTDCIRLLIELNGHLGKLGLTGGELHTRLNTELNRILLCRNYPSVVSCTTDYMEWLVGQLDGLDSRNPGIGVVHEIQMFIRRHYAENITLNYLAEHFYLHSNYLSRLFKEKTGKNFIDYLTDVRMENAKELLTNTEHKIIEICAMTGYDNPRYFSKLFKSYTGMTPREYREKSCN